MIDSIADTYPRICFIEVNQLITLFNWVTRCLNLTLLLIKITYRQVNDNATTHLNGKHIFVLFALLLVFVSTLLPNLMFIGINGIIHT